MIHITHKGTKIPALGYGTWQLRGPDCKTGVAKALEIGYRHIDTAQIYENEAEVGAAIAESGVKRGDIFLTTKVWNTNLQSDAMRKSVDESLKKLKTDHVDLLLIHWPINDVPFAEQLKGLQDVKKAGLAKLIGVSNFTVAQMKEVVETIGADVATNQVEYHPFLSQKPVLDYLRGKNMFLTAYSPLARGKVAEAPLLQELGKKYGKLPGQITLRWLLQQPGVSAIPKAGSEQHLKKNFEIFDFKLDDSEMQKIHALAKPDGRMISPEWAPKWDKAA